MNFKLRGKNLFLTYPKYDGELEFIRSELSGRFLRYGLAINKYIIASERHEDGDYHRHCYIGLSDELRYQGKADIFDVGGAHPNIQTVRSIEKVIKYCSKEDDYITNIPFEVARAKSRAENGTPKKKEELGRELMAGKSLTTMVAENPQLIFGFSRLYMDVQIWRLLTGTVLPLEGPCGVWIGGPSGAGKTTIAATKFGTLYEKGNSKWFTGYDPDTHAGIRIDDIDDTWKDVFFALKQWAHEFPFSAPYHGGQFLIRPRRIVITSNFSIAELALKFGISDPTPWERRFDQYWITHWSDWVPGSSGSINDLGRGE